MPGGSRKIFLPSSQIRRTWGPDHLHIYGNNDVPPSKPLNMETACAKQLHRTRFQEQDACMAPPASSPPHPTWAWGLYRYPKYGVPTPARSKRDSCGYPQPWVYRVASPTQGLGPPCMAVGQLGSCPKLGYDDHKPQSNQQPRLQVQISAGGSQIFT